jgi:hypothetical protein
MQTLLTILTALSLATHAMAGCCWHHAQSCACDGLTVVEPAEAELCCRHCNHVEHKQSGPSQADPHACDSLAGVCHGAADCGPQEDATPAGPCDCKIECHGTCTYLPPEKSSVDDAAHVQAFAQPVIAHLDDSSTDLLSANWEWLADPVDSARPLRIHVLHQVFLI